jgi:hypothetical protein
MREFGVQVASLSETIRRLDKSTGRMFLVASIRGGDVEDDSTRTRVRTRSIRSVQERLGDNAPALVSGPRRR